MVVKTIIGRYDGMRADFHEVGVPNTFGVLSIILRRPDSSVGMVYLVDHSCSKDILKVKHR